MARIRCRYVGCIYLDEGVCTSTIVTLDPEEGCVTFKQAGDPYDTDDWDYDNEDEELDGYDEWDDEDEFEESLYEEDEEDDF